VSPATGRAGRSQDDGVLQLASCLALTLDAGPPLAFVSLDDLLNLAARREGLVVVGGR
jgi:hypothetical protein